MKLNIKHSLLKFLSHIYKGTTYGYATRRDCIVAFVFLFLLNFAYAFIVGILGIQSYNDFIPALFLTLPFIIAIYSLWFMRINDIFGKHFMKGRVPEFFGICFLLEGCGRIVAKMIFNIEPINSIGWSRYLFWFILCIYPPAKEREEMPEVEYELPKLPKKATTVLAIALAITMVIIIVILAMTYYNGYK